MFPQQRAKTINTPSHISLPLAPNHIKIWAHPFITPLLRMPLGTGKKVRSLAAVFCLVCGKKLHWVTGNLSPFSAPFFPASMWSSVSYSKTCCFIVVTVSLWRGGALCSCLVWIWYCYSGFCGSAGRGAAVARGYWFTVQDNAFCWLCITLNAPTCTFPKLLSSK